MTEEPKIRIVAILGTVRPGSYTSKALALVGDEFAKHDDVTLEVVDPAELDLRLPGRGVSEDAQRLREVVSNATGVVLSTPEYHGGYSATIKLVIENLGFPSALAGKPIALLGVAAGQIGAIKSLESLRSVCSHVGALVLPGPVSVARVREVFAEDGTISDRKVERRIRGVATNLMQYIQRHICPAMALESMVREDAA